MVKICQTFKWA